MDLPRQNRRMLTAGWKCFVVISMLALSVGCNRGAPHTEKSAAAKANGNYIVMEKVLADTPGRPRTTMKIVIPNAVGRQAVSDTMSKALDDTKKDDSSLKAVIIWAYRTREELNSSTYTAGKLEWSADGKDFNGTKPLATNPEIDVVKR